MVLPTNVAGPMEKGSRMASSEDSMAMQVCLRVTIDDYMGSEKGETQKQETTTARKIQFRSVYEW